MSDVVSLEKLARLAEAALRRAGDVPLTVTARSVPILHVFDRVTVNGRELVVTKITVRNPTVEEIIDGFDPEGRVQEVTLIDPPTRQMGSELGSTPPPGDPETPG